MASQKTRCDSFITHLTGAATHLGTQTDPNASLGNRVSSTTFGDIGIGAGDFDLGALNVYVNRAGYLNGPGTGVVTAVDATTVNWTPPGGTAGANVTIANGVPALLEGGGTDGAQKWIVITPNGAQSASGTGNVVLSRTLHNMFDHVSSAELAAGDIEYRCLAPKCQNASGVTVMKLRCDTQGTSQVTGTAQLGASGAGTVTTAGSFASWPADGYATIYTNAPAQREVIYYSSRTGTSLTVPAAGRGLLGSTAAAGAATDRIYCLVGGIALAKSTTATGPTPTFETPADESTAPTGPTFTVPIRDDANAIDTRISVGTVAENDFVGVWLKRQVAAGAVSNPAIPLAYIMDYDAA